MAMAELYMAGLNFKGVPQHRYNLQRLREFLFLFSLSFSTSLLSSASQYICQNLPDNKLKEWRFQIKNTGFCFFFFGLFFFRAAPVAYGGSQARGLIRAVAASLRQSHSNARSELPLWPTPQLRATPDP